MSTSLLTVTVAVWHNDFPSELPVCLRFLKICAWEEVSLLLRDLEEERVCGAAVNQVRGEPWLVYSAKSFMWRSQQGTCLLDSWPICRAITLGRANPPFSVGWHELGPWRIWGIPQYWSLHLLCPSGPELYLSKMWDLQTVGSSSHSVKRAPSLAPPPPSSFC